MPTPSPVLPSLRIPCCLTTSVCVCPESLLHSSLPSRSLSLPPISPFPFFWSNCPLRPGSFRFGRQAWATGECHAMTPDLPPTPSPACHPSCLSPVALFSPEVRPSPSTDTQMVPFVPAQASGPKAATPRIPEPESWALLLLTSPPCLLFLLCCLCAVSCVSPLSASGPVFSQEPPAPSVRTWRGARVDRSRPVWY